MKYRINVTAKLSFYEDTVDGAFNQLIKLIDGYEEEGFKLTEALHGEYLLQQDDKTVILNIQKEYR